MKKQTMKKIAAIAGSISIAFGAGIGAGFILDQPQMIEIEKPIIVEKEVAVPYNVTQEVIVEKEIEVEKIIEVPLNGTDDVIEFIIDESGNINELDLDEIEDKGFEELISQVAFIYESKEMAAEYVKHEFADEADKMNVSGIILDEDDIERIRIDSDMDEITAEDIDFEDKDMEVTVTGTFEHDDEDFEFEAKIEIKDGRVDDFDIESITKQ